MFDMSTIFTEFNFICLLKTYECKTVSSSSCLYLLDSPVPECGY